MSTVIQTPALILRHADDREHDRRLVALTPEFGALQLRARGTKKSQSKLGGSLEPVTEVHLTLANGRQIDVVAGSVIKQRWPKLRTNLVGFVAAQWLLELVERVSKPHQSDPEFYQMVTEMLTQMETEADQPAGQQWLHLLRRAWRIIEHAGFAPDPAVCSRCHKMLTDDERVYDPLHGWLHVSEASSHAWRLDPVAVAFLRSGQPPDDPKKLWRDVHRLVQSVIEHTLDQPLRSERVLQKVMR